jgi:hypothetical protein
MRVKTSNLKTLVLGLRTTVWKAKPALSVGFFTVVDNFD